MRAKGESHALRQRVTWFICGGETVLLGTGGTPVGGTPKNEGEVSWQV